MLSIKKSKGLFSEKMISNYDSEIDKTKIDPSINISVTPLTSEEDESAFVAAVIPKGEEAFLHYHQDGVDLNFIVSGHGELHVSEMDTKTLKILNKKVFKVQQGDYFSMPNYVAHKLKAKSDMKVLFVRSNLPVELLRLSLFRGIELVLSHNKQGF